MTTITENNTDVLIKLKDMDITNIKTIESFTPGTCDTCDYGEKYLYNVKFETYAVTLHKNDPYVTIYDVRNNLEPHGITNIQYVGQDRGNLHILVKLPSHA